jgi:tRNA threonylcarbamoyladenosine biosynthesis protein TsaE
MGKEEVYHFDCYRIKDLREAMDMGTEEYLYSGNYCFIEWAEMIEALLPEDIVTVDIEVQDNGDRLLTVSM